MKKKLIEVALPLEAINKESAREKSIRHGHPSTLHLWWARRPLAACRAVLFASLVDDPGSRPDLFPTEEEQHAERERLFDLISELVKWDNSNNESLLKQAKEAIWGSAGPEGPPPIYDPFCGGGSIPLEAQRLGLESHGSDLNPVAVLITKALIEIPSKFVGRAPINPESKSRIQAKWPGATGLTEDVRHYGAWMRGRVQERLGHLYPLAKQRDGAEATVIAWLWARTATCPNPACGATMPLVRNFALSSRVGRERWVEPIVTAGATRVKFLVREGADKPPEPTKVGRGARFRCLFCGQTAEDWYIKSEGCAGRMGVQLMAIVAQGGHGRIYLDPSDEHSQVALEPHPTWGPDSVMPTNARWFGSPAFGMTKFRDLFTGRQLFALSTFADYVTEARVRAISDGADPEYADALAIYLAFAVDKMADRNTMLCGWEVKMDRMRNTFGRQALPMVWDFAETNPFAGAAGDFGGCVESLCEVLERLGTGRPGVVTQRDASKGAGVRRQFMFSTDPPYYDNIGYADLSDFFYVWLRRSLRNVQPQLFETLLVPKAEELVATPYRFEGSRERAQQHFEAGFGRAFAEMQRHQHPEYPLTVFYAFKQAESDDSDEDEGSAASVASTGWETMLEGLLRAGFGVTGTWPMRSELSTRNIGRGTNALASSILLVCRPRPESASITTRKDFLAALKSELPPALRALQQGNIAPVDLAQAAIGPGMAVFSRYAKVLENDGSTMRVRTALQLINQMLDEVLSEQESDFDPDTRFALTWFEQRGFDEGPYGDAETLATARAISVSGLTESGIASARAGKVKLIARKDLPPNWDPTADGRLTVWEATQYLIRALEEKGEPGAAELASKLGGLGETARELAYRLYTLCERKGWTEEAIAYNSLVVSWPAIVRHASIASEEFRLK